jgi:hypothetical protein
MSAMRVSVLALCNLDLAGMVDVFDYLTIAHVEPPAASGTASMIAIGSCHVVIEAGSAMV